MSKRNRREHGRIISVETLTRGDSLAADVAAGATSITVNDAGDFDEDGGWLYIGAQAVEYTACDDDTGIITLATALAAAGEQGDPVQVWSDLYDEVVDYQLALVELDGEYDNPDPVVAEVAEGVGDLPEGDRGKAGESCTLLRVADDEWEVVGVGGRSRKSRGQRYEDSDVHVVAVAGAQTFTLSHLPEFKGIGPLYWCPEGGAGIIQSPQNYTVDYMTGTVTFPDTEGYLVPGDELRVWYAYRQGITTEPATTPLSTTTVLATGGVVSVTTSTGDAVIVGASPQWGDGSDATYASMKTHREFALSGVTTAKARLATVDLTALAAITVTARIRCEADAALQRPSIQIRSSVTEAFCYTMSTSPGGSTPFGGPDWVELTLSPTGGGATTFLSLLAAGTAEVLVRSPYPPSTPYRDYTTKVYEVQIMVSET